MVQKYFKQQGPVNSSVGTWPSKPVTQTGSRRLISCRKPELRTFGAYYDASLAGYYELRRDDRDGVEIAYFGLLPKFIGRGFGGALLTSAIEEAWRASPSITRVWVHTCTCDHPHALANYQARGMVIYKREPAES